MSNGTFSKLLGPGLRTGWAEGTPALAYELSQCGSTRSGGAASQFSASIVSEMMLAGEVDPHIEGLKSVYARRRETVAREIEQMLKDLDAGGSVRQAGGWKPSADPAEEGIVGGYFIWIDFPAGLSAVELSVRAADEENLVLAPGKIFEVPGDESVVFDGGVRICFSWVEEDELVEGIERLGRLIKKMLEEKKSGAGSGEVQKVNWVGFR